MRITFTTERGQAVTLDLLPGENAWITTDQQPEPTSRSLYLSNQGTLGTGEYDEAQAWWYFTPINIPTVTRPI